MASPLLYWSAAKDVAPSVEYVTVPCGQVESGQTLKAVGEAAGVCPRTVRKWVFRYRSEGLAGLRDRSSRPHRLHAHFGDCERRFHAMVSAHFI